MDFWLDATRSHRESGSASRRSGSSPSSLVLARKRPSSPCTTVIAESWETMPCPSSWRRVVGVGGRARAASTADHRPDMPKCTCTTTSGAPSSEKKANRFLPRASSRESTRPSIAAAPSAKRPFGDVA
eukprot:scaffold80914_cov30-Tisochrysis_lutea.AAC.6